MVAFAAGAFVGTEAAAGRLQTQRIKIADSTRHVLDGEKLPSSPPMEHSCRLELLKCSHLLLRFGRFSIVLFVFDIEFRQLKQSYEINKFRRSLIYGASGGCVLGSFSL